MKNIKLFEDFEDEGKVDYERELIKEVKRVGAVHEVDSPSEGGTQTQTYVYFGHKGEDAKEPVTTTCR